MALAEQAKLVVTLGLQDKTKAGVKSIRGGLRGLNLDAAHLKKSIGNVGGSLKTGLKVGAGVAVGGLALLAATVSKGVDALAEQERLDKLTAAALKSTGGAAKVTAGHIKTLAGALEDKTTIDDKQIQAGENLLLRFKDIRNEVGKGNDIYDRAVQASLDLGTATGDVDGAFGKLGKALNDPVKGMKQLQRVGVKFTDKEKAAITTAVKHGDTLKAQRLILDKLALSYGGSAAAAADTFTGKQNRLHDAVEDVEKAVATGLMPRLGELATKLSDVMKDPAVLQRVTDFGTKLGGLLSDKNLDTGASKLKDFWGYLSTQVDWAAIKGGLQTTFDVSKKAFEMFNGMDPEMKKILIGALAVNKLSGGLFKDVVVGFGGLVLKSLQTITANTVTVVGRSVTGPPTGPNGPTPIPTGKPTLPEGAIVPMVGAVAAVDLGPIIQGSTDKQTANLEAALASGDQNAADRARIFLEGNRQFFDHTATSDAETLAAIDRVSGKGDLTNAALATMNAMAAIANATIGPPLVGLPDQISELKRSFSTGSSGIEAAVRAKNMAVTVNVTTNVSVRDVARTISTRNRLGSVPM